MAELFQTRPRPAARPATATMTPAAMPTPTAARSVTRYCLCVVRANGVDVEILPSFFRLRDTAERERTWYLTKWKNIKIVVTAVSVPLPTAECVELPE